MNSKYVSSVQEAYEALLTEIVNTPPTASVFLLKNKTDWIEELNVQISNLKLIQKELNKEFFSGSGI